MATKGLDTEQLAADVKAMKETGNLADELRTITKEPEPAQDHPYRRMSMEELLDAEAADGWRPEPGSRVGGTVVAISTGGIRSQYGSYPLLTLRQTNGEFIKVHAFHDVLRNALRSKMVGEGDDVLIRYEGPKQGDDFTYENYTVVVRHAQGAPTRLRPDSA